VFRWARFINFPISLEGTTTSRNPIFEWIDGLRREAGFVLLSTLGNGRVLIWKMHINANIQTSMLQSLQLITSTIVVTITITIIIIIIIISQIRKIHLAEVSAKEQK
jgi:hypothetical protein